VKITISIQDEGAARLLIEGEYQAQNLEGALVAIAGELDDRVQQSFESASDPVNGSSWPELRPATLRQKARKGYGPSPLQNTRILRLGVIAETDRHGVSVSAGSVEYAKFHQYGTSKTPQRRFAGMSPEDAIQFEDILARHITGA